MSFTRSPSGISNYRRFTHSDIIVYIEGKYDPAQAGGETCDEKFYRSLLESIAPQVKFKIKCVGNREAAFSHLSVIESGAVSSAFVIVDRDSSGIASSIISHPMLVYTDGYSWENDLWTQRVTSYLVDEFTARNANAKAKINEIFPIGIRRLKFLSALDLASRSACPGALLPKNGGACGISFDYRRKYPIPAKEITRVLAKYRSSEARTCSVSQYLLKKAMKAPSDKVIQGHLWEHYVFNLFVSVLKDILGTAQISKELARNVAFGLLSRRAKDCLGAKKFNYYRTSIGRLLPQA